MVSIGRLLFVCSFTGAKIKELNECLLYTFQAKKYDHTYTS